VLELKATLVPDQQSAQHTPDHKPT